MTNLHNDQQQNLVNFLRHNQPIPPQEQPDLEQKIIDSLGKATIAKERKRHFKVTRTIPSAIATGFLFTSVSFGLKTPRIAVEPQDLENFLVKNWHNSLNKNNSTVMDRQETYLLPSDKKQQPALSVSSQ